jgi:hypothetical protein
LLLIRVVPGSFASHCPHPCAQGSPLAPEYLGNLISNPALPMTLQPNRRVWYSHSPILPASPYPTWYWLTFCCFLSDGGSPSLPCWPICRNAVLMCCLVLLTLFTCVPDCIAFLFSATPWPHTPPSPPLAWSLAHFTGLPITYCFCPPELPGPGVGCFICFAHQPFQEAQKSILYTSFSECPQVESTLSVSTPPMVTFRPSAIPTKTPMPFFTEIEKQF